MERQHVGGVCLNRTGIASTSTRYKGCQRPVMLVLPHAEPLMHLNRLLSRPEPI